MDAIETERLVLRNFRKADAADLLAYTREPAAGCFLDQRLEDLAAAEREAERRGGGDAEIAVCLRENGLRESGLRQSGRLIGDLFAFAEGDTVAVGWNFNPAFGGAGYALEAARALFAHLFEVRGARRLYAYVEEENAASRRLCARLGMRQEGAFLDFVSFRTDAAGAPIYETTLQFALLRREWRARR